MPDLRSLPLVLCASLLLTACTDADRPSYTETLSEDTTTVLTPGQTVVAMLHAYFDKRFEEYYTHVSAADQASKSVEALKAEFAPSVSDLVTDYLFRLTDVKVDSQRVAGDSALVWISALSPDIGSVVQQGAIVERSLGSDTDLDTKLNILNERLKQRGSPKEWNYSTYTLAREDGQWKVRVGWAEQDSLVGRIHAE
jgi:hypothetical protein